MNDADKVRAYDARTPGVNIPDAQKVERVERLQSREKFGAKSVRGRAGARPSIIVSRLWPGHRDYEGGVE